MSDYRWISPGEPDTCTAHAHQRMPGAAPTLVLPSASPHSVMEPHAAPLLHAPRDGNFLAGPGCPAFVLLQPLRRPMEHPHATHMPTFSSAHAHARAVHHHWALHGAVPMQCGWVSGCTAPDPGIQAGCRQAQRGCMGAMKGNMGWWGGWRKVAQQRVAGLTDHPSDASAADPPRTGAVAHQMRCDAFGHPILQQHRADCFP